MAENMMEMDTVLAVSSPDILFSAVTLQQVMESLLLMVMEACVEKKATLCDLARK